MHTLAALLLLAPALRATGVFLPAIFKDGMVLQTPADGGGAVAVIFGFADPGEAVVVNMTLPGRTAPETFSTLADSATGKWSVNVSPTSGDLEPSDVTFSIAAASDASPTLIVNASFGEVILCNGQSNMVMSVAAATTPWGRAGPPSVVLQNSTWPLIRLFSVITADASTPQRDLPVYINRTATRCTWGWVNSSIPLPPQAMVCQTWQVAAPGVTDFLSAECFYTAHELMASGAIPGTQVEQLCLIPGSHAVRFAPQLGARSASSKRRIQEPRWRRGCLQRHSTGAQQWSLRGLSRRPHSSPTRRRASGMQWSIPLLDTVSGPCFTIRLSLTCEASSCPH